MHSATCTATYMLGIDNVDSADSNAHDDMIALLKIQMCRIAICVSSEVFLYGTLRNWAIDRPSDRRQCFHIFGFLLIDSC